MSPSRSPLRRDGQSVYEQNEYIPSTSIIRCTPFKTKPWVVLTYGRVSRNPVRFEHHDPSVAYTAHRYLDFINVMAYDFHGKWERETGHNAPLYAPSSDSEWRKQLSVDNAASIWSKMGAPKDKLVIGMPTYGRTFTLSNPANYKVNSPASGGGKAGEYTKEAGFLAYYEVSTPRGRK